MYLSIIPFSHSLSPSPLTYVGGDVFHEGITLGCIVEIPLGKCIEYGLVVGISEENISEIQDIKSILRIVTKRTVIAPYQIDMILFLARKYMLPIHRVLGFILTRPILNRLEKYGYDILTEDVLPELPSIGDQTTRRHSVVFFGETPITPEILGEYMTDKTVVICPDDFSLENYRQYYENESTLFLSNETTDTRKAKAWIDIRNGKYTQIFGTRRILYYNLMHYTHILYLEDAFGREYFHYPSRIHYLDVLFSLENTPQITINILSSAPLLTTLARSRKHFNITNYS